MEAYRKGHLLGIGTFGKVHQYTQIATNQVVAIKRIHLQQAKEGLNMTALREIKLLRELDSPHFARLLDVFSYKSSLCLVFEYCESDLEQLIRDHRTLLSPGDVKAYMAMILQALGACHAAWVLHRDVKPNNFLITSSGQLKLGDFGLARIFGSPDRQLTHQVFALWYRAPELFFGSRCYGPSVDIWAAGCIFAELMLRRPWFQAQTHEGKFNAPTELDTLGQMFSYLGTPSEETWPGMSNLRPGWSFEPLAGQPLKSIFTQASDDALDLLSQMMAFDPNKRITAEAALQHRYFSTAPAPTAAHLLPRAPARATQPLKLAPKGGSALQEAPPLTKAANADAAPAAPSIARSPLAEANVKSSEEARAGDSAQVMSHAGSPPLATPQGWGTLRADPNAPRPQIDDEDLRSLKKRKLDLDG